MYEMQIVPGLDSIVIRLDGDIGYGETEQIEESIREALKAGPTSIEVDCRSLRFADSMFLRMMLVLDKECRERDDTLIMTNVPPHISRLFAYTGLEKHFSWTPLQDTGESTEPEGEEAQADRQPDPIED